MLKIGDVARQAGLTADAIRYYERLGLVPKPARTAAGYRQYPPGVVRRLALVRNAQRLGFPLKEIAGFLRVRDAGGRPCHDVRAGAKRILSAVDRQISMLMQARRDIRRTLREWDRKLATSPAHELAYLLEDASADKPRRS